MTTAAVLRYGDQLSDGPTVDGNLAQRWLSDFNMPHCRQRQQQLCRHVRARDAQ